MSVADNLARVRARIEDACARVGRSAGEVTLVAVSKRHGEDAIRAAHAAGQRDFGENFVQELVDKAGRLSDLELNWHFIGHLQRNKARHVARPRYTVQCVDSTRIADALQRRAVEAGITLPVLIQVNVDADPHKSGVSQAQLDGLIAHVRDLAALRLDGLMTIPEHTEDPEGARPAFRRLRELVDLHSLSVCSMGMTHDLEIAVEEGASMVRVGTAIFGPRP